jgi:branched-chain amino acid transport system substrate-binding protein
MPRARRSAALLMLFAPMLSGAACGPHAEPEPLTIGQLVALSGPNKLTGEHATNGAGLAVEVALREERRVLGRKVAVRHVDTRGELDLVQAEAVRLLTLNRIVALLGGVDPAANEQLARSVQTYGVPVLLASDVATLPVGDSVFCLDASPESRGEALARYAARDLHCRRAVALTDDHAGPGVPLAASFIKRWRQEHPDDKEAFAQAWSCPNEGAWNEAFSRTLAAKPDAVLLAVGLNEFPQLRRRLVATGFKGPVFYGGEDKGADPLADLRREEPAGEGSTVYLATGFSTRAELGTKGQAFVREYEEKFGEPPDLAAALAYDGVQLLIDALDRAKTAQPPRLTEELMADTDFPGVTGSLSLAGRQARRPVFVVKLHAGEVKVVGTFGPGLE